eukprot:1496401-Rhodomonas_salina.1
MQVRTTARCGRTSPSDSQPAPGSHLDQDLADINAISNPSKLPHPDDSDRHADIEFQKRTKTRRAVVGDVSLTHPFTGDANDRTTWGTCKPNALQHLTGEKNGKYGRWHDAHHYMFLPSSARLLERSAATHYYFSFAWQIWRRPNTSRLSETGSTTTTD